MEVKEVHLGGCKGKGKILLKSKSTLKINAFDSHLEQLKEKNLPPQQT